MRIFIAVNFDDEIKSQLFKVINTVKRQCDKGDFTKKDNLHLTLAFLGEVEPGDISDVEEAIDSVSFKPFNLRIGKMGRFRRNDGDIYWLKIEDCPELSRLQKELNIELKKRSFTVDNRKFKPHLTIGRRVKGDFEMIKSVSFKIDSQTVAGIDLMLSSRTHGSLEYRKIY